MPFVEKIIIVDGAFKAYPHKYPFSTDHTKKIAVANCGRKLKWVDCPRRLKRIDPTHRIPLDYKPWPDQVTKRNEYLKHVPNGKHFYVIDSDVVVEGRVKREFTLIEKQGFKNVGIEVYNYHLKWDGRGFLNRSRFRRTEWVGYHCEKPALRIFLKRPNMRYKGRHCNLYDGKLRIINPNYVLTDVMQTNYNNIKSWKQWAASIIYKLRRPEAKQVPGVVDKFMKKFSRRPISEEEMDRIAKQTLVYLHDPVEYFNFYNELAEKYPESEIVYSGEAGREREKLLAKILKKKRGFLTLDLGCGDGHYRKHIPNFVGLDIARASLLKFEGDRIWGLAESLPFASEAFDIIFMSETLEHIEEREKVLEECCHILKPGGEIILSAPHGYAPWAITENWRVLVKYGVKFYPYLHGRLSKRYLTKLFKEVGFNMIYTRIIKSSPRKQGRIIIIAKKKG